MSATLKQELKAWEASFRADHGRDPTKQDIKLAPEIARKYKEYNKSKQAPVPAPSIFKTPTKPRPSTSRHSLPAHDDNPFLATDASTSTTTTTKSTSASKSKSDGTQYVLANSPSKLRALAAMHSTSGSPNRPSGPNWANAAASGSNSTSTSLPKSKQRSSTVTAPPAATADFDRSPRKALNPFASPRKKEVVTIQPPSRGTTLFGDFERLEREKLKKKKPSASRVKVKSGMGWGHASDPFSTSVDRAPSSRGGRDESMEVDEVDDFFGGGGASAKKKQNHSSLTGTVDRSSSSNPFIRSPATTRQIADEEEDDEMLGPSPVKPSTSSFRRTSSFGFDQTKPFKPLFDDPMPPPPAPPSLSQSGATKPPPKLFESSLRIPAPLSTTTDTATTNRGTKRATTNSGGKGGGAVKGKSRGRDDMDDLLEDDDDAFYADALDTVEKDLEGAANGGKGKRKRAAATGAGRGRAARGRGKGKGRARDAGDAEDEGDGGEEVDDELRVERDERGGLVLDLRVDGPVGTAEGGEELRERIMIHQQGRRDPRRNRGDEEDEGGGDEFIRDEVSLLDRPEPRPLVSSRVRKTPTADEERSTQVHAALPSDLASILSLRASPQKSATSAKDRQVAKLLREPTAVAQSRRRGGLLELEDAAEEEWDGAREEEGEGDDDWDEEVDGWKQTGEAMDGYYSGGDGW
ncbi:hypothetical protein JCM11491_002013 [Sporobolomyces phaffii]